MFGMAPGNEVDRFSVRAENTDEHVGTKMVGSEDGKRVSVGALQQGVQFSRREDGFFRAKQGHVVFQLCGFSRKDARLF
jgi:hypothetical protein